MNGQFDFGAIQPSRYFLSIALVLGFLFGLVTPLEDGQSRLLTLLQWLLQSLIPMGVLVFIHMLLHTSRTFDALNPWIKLATVGGLASVLYAPVAFLLDHWFEQEPMSEYWLGLIEEWLAVSPPIVICWIAINAPWVLGYSVLHKKAHNPAMLDAIANDIGRDTKKADSDSLEPSTFSSNKQFAEKAKFWSLVSPNLGCDLIYLKAELHYLKVVTTQGSELILYNLKDAVNDLPSYAGSQCHRSYWVAYKHVKSLVKQGRQGCLNLYNGKEIPVSRNRLQAITERLGKGNIGL